MAGLTSIFRRQQDDLSERQDKVRYLLSEEYEKAYRAIQSELEKIEALIDSTDKPDRSWLQKQRVYHDLMDGIDKAFNTFGEFTETTIIEEQTKVAALALTDTDALLKSMKKKPGTLKMDKLSEILEGLKKRITDLNLPKIIPQAVKDTARKVLNKSLISTQKAAGKAQKALGSILSHVLTVQQSESMNAYRTVGMQVSKVSGVTHWQWVARLHKTPPPCAICCAMHGKVFEITVPFGTHPNCYCISLPVVGWALPSDVNGAEWFAQQSRELQRNVLGPKKLTLYESGEIDLPDLVGHDTHPEYGVIRWEKSAKSMGY